MHNNKPSIAVITGATGGMGRMCARLLGRRHSLALVDIDQKKLERDASTLKSEGYNIALAKLVDISDQKSVAQLAIDIDSLGSLGALIHTAGLSPALATWDAIIKVNILGTVYLLKSFYPLIKPDTVAVCIASIAGHSWPQTAIIDQILDQPLCNSFLERIKPCLEESIIPDDPYGLASPAYALSKYSVIRQCEQLAQVWAEQGGRIISLSPGMIATPMGHKEIEENPMAAAMFDSVPNKRIGTPLDIANTVDFLCSKYASYINGCDLKVDYGVVAANKHASV